MISQIVSHYKIVKRLGSGGMGEVYLAEDLMLDRQVALKFLSPPIAHDPDAKARFVREARAAARLNHPSICTIHEIDESDDHLFIVMEHIRGRTLQDILKSGPLPMHEAIRIGTAICEGLQEAHRRNVIHRDIKSANIMIMDSGQVKIMDFGLARSIGQTRLTKQNRNPGTVAYMSFEQAAGQDVDHRTDIWSLGVILFEMLTGTLPFTGDADQVILYAILNKDPVTNPDIPNPLEKIVHRALEKDPNHRYQHVRDLMKDLDPYPYSGERQNRFVQRRAGGVSHHAWLRPVSRWLILIMIIIYGLMFFIHHDHAIDSIAVLPMENLSGNPDQIYFVEGLQDALITQLSRISALRVISKTSTMQFAETEKTIPEIARELNVDALLEGSVLRDRDRVRISAQLIRGSSDEHLWAQSYDRDLDDLLMLIREIAKTIADQIEIAIHPDEWQRLDYTILADMQVHELVFEGRYYFDRMQFRKSLSAYERAADLAPDFAPAHAGMGMACMIMGFFGQEPMSLMIPRARTSVLKALSLDDQNAEAYGTLGYIQLYHDWDWPAARSNLLKALELSPNDAMMRHTYADYLLVMGDVEGSLKQVQIGHLYDPLSPIANMVLRYHLFMTPGHDEILEECKEALNRNANDESARAIYRDLLWYKGMYEEAMIQYRLSWGKDEEFLQALERGYDRHGPTGAIRALAQTVAQRVPDYTDYYSIAQLYAQAGVQDTALVWLEQAYENRQFQLLHVKAWPLFRVLHPNPGFQNLLNRIGFPPGPTSTQRGR